MTVSGMIQLAVLLLLMKVGYDLAQQLYANDRKDLYALLQEHPVIMVPATWLQRNPAGFASTAGLLLISWYGRRWLVVILDGLGFETAADLLLSAGFGTIRESEGAEGEVPDLEPVDGTVCHQRTKLQQQTSSPQLNQRSPNRRQFIANPSLKAPPRSASEPSLSETSHARTRGANATAARPDDWLVYDPICGLIPKEVKERWEEQAKSLSSTSTPQSNPTSAADGARPESKVATRDQSRRRRNKRPHPLGSRHVIPPVRSQA